MQTDNILAKSVQLIVNNSSSAGESMASLSQNPFVTWIKFILTDDKPNANEQRVPKEEFANIIKTGMFMPVKLSEQAAEALELNHLGSKPIGTITHLRENEDHIEAIAALWSAERPEDIDLIKQRFNNGQPVNVSWELKYDDSISETTDDGHINLRGVVMNAATIVDLPSYMGRTPVLAVASISKEANTKFNTILAKISDGKDLSEIETTILAEINEILIRGENEPMDTITREDHEKIVNGLQADLDTFKKQLETATTTIETLEPLKVELEELKPKYATLEQFKNEADEAKQKQEKLDGIRQKLNDAKITVDDDFMNEKEEILLEMTEASLDFFIQELVAFSRKAVSNADAEASINLTSDLPGIDSSDDPGNGRVSTRDAVEFLRETFDK